MHSASTLSNKQVTLTEYTPNEMSTDASPTNKMLTRGFEATAPEWFVDKVETTEVK